ncbi:CBS domain-containing protein [Halobium salinum]|uniref:CBS domain-containing protein n=1 Tax=Halobium salinum TaxID=1364940 RepID=A0ABD5PG79_9EURY|nr:CBS domain-containing protein [Halobium salinum]
MDVRELVSTEFPSFDAEARISRLTGAFEDPTRKAVVVTEDGEYAGVVTRRQLDAARRDPNAKIGSLRWHVARLDADDDVRTAARLMLGSDAKVLPVFDDGAFVGVLTADAVLGAVEPYLDVLRVDDVATMDGEAAEGLVSVTRGTTLGEALHLFRDHRVTHLPVLDAGSAVGVVSLVDVVEFTTRDANRSQGGGSPLSTPGGRSHGGFGAREGELDRLLDLPVRDVMSEPVVTVGPDERLDRAVGTMLDYGVSSLVVTDDESGATVGIVTTTDVLESLTWTDERRLPVQITGVDLLDDLDRETVSDMVERATRKYGDMTVLEANVALHEHDEKLRGTPLVLARVRLFTDKGHFVATGEGYGARHALTKACSVLERKVREAKEYGWTKKHDVDGYRRTMAGGHRGRRTP